MKILLTGANGQLGRCIQDRVANDLSLIALNSKQLDITDKQQVNRAVLKFQPDIIINAAAYTAVDKAEAKIDCAMSVNKTGVENLAIAANEFNMPIIHVSTDYVFDGTSVAPYEEDSFTNPVSIYGLSKLLGEHVLQAHYSNHVILRTAWVFSEYGNNFVKTMLRLAKDRDEINVVSDQIGCPTYAGDLASAILSIARQIHAGNKSRGIFHYCGDVETSWYGFACEIFELALTQCMIESKPRVIPISTEQYPLPATRPQYSVLNCQKLKSVWGIKPASWHSSLMCILRKTYLRNEQ